MFLIQERQLSLTSLFKTPSQSVVGHFSCFLTTLLIFNSITIYTYTTGLWKYQILLLVHRQVNGLNPLPIPQISAHSTHLRMNSCAEYLDSIYKSFCSFNFYRTCL